MTKFLAKGEGSYVYFSRDGYSVHMDLGGYIFMIEATTNRDGFYDQDDQPVDEEVQAVYEHLLEKEANGFAGKTIDQMVDVFIRAFHQQEFSEIRGVPKLTKALAQGLDKQDECITFYMSSDDDALEFMCFGARPIIVASAEELGCTTLTLSPLYYYYATQFRGEASFLTSTDLIIVTNSDKTMGAIIMGVDIVERDTYIKNKRIENEG